jgi:SAM-dependent methyltransferase
MWSEEYIESEMPPQEQTDLEVAFLVEVLGLHDGGRVLDVACGAGRHAQGLAQRGCRVVGADTSRPLLHAAQGRRNASNPSYVRADMRSLPFRAAFDVVICLFASFGLFGDRDNRRTFRSMADAVRPGGRLVIETWSPLGAAALDGRRNWWRVGGRLYLAEVDYDAVAGSVHDQRHVFDPFDGSWRSWTRTTRFYTPPELDGMARRAGVKSVEWFGDYDGADLDPTCPRVIGVFERPQ